MRRHCRTGLRRDGREHRGQIVNLSRGGRLDVGTDRELVVELRRIDERHPGTRQGGLAHAVRQHRHLAAQVRTDDQQALEMIHVGDAQPQVRIQRIGGLIAEVTHPQSMIDVLRTQPPGQAVEQVQLLGGCRGAAERADVAGVLAQAVHRHSERGLPAHLGPAAALADQRRTDAVGAVHALIAEPVAVGDPGLVDGFVVTGHHAHQLAPQHVAEKIRADTVMRRHHRMGDHFPGAGREAERLRVQRAHRTQVDDVAREFMIHGALDEGPHRTVLAAADHAQFLDAGNLLRETDAAGALDAAGHVGGDQGS